MKRFSNGFTIIELLVVIAVIGILSTISLVSFNRYQATSRDTQRSSRATIISEALEKYYDKNGEYPSCAAMTADGAVLTTTTLQGLQSDVLKTPTAAPTQTNSIDLCQEMTISHPDDSFAYVGDGSATCATGSSCLAYSLQYKEEGSNTIKTITSRHTTDISTSGDTSLTGTPINASQVNLSWGEISNASSYELVRATNSGFTAGVSTLFPTSNSQNVTGLSGSTQYWFRVRAISVGGNSNWSNTFTVTTHPAAPINTVVATASSTQVNITWNSVSGATSYRVQRSTTSNFAGGTTGSASGITTNSHVQSGLAQGTQYWFRVYAVNSTGESAASNIDDAITTLPAPTGLATTRTSTSINASWTDVTNATAYDVQYSTAAGFSPLLGSFNDQTATSRNITGLTQGDTYYIRVYAKTAVTQSPAATISETTIITPPPAYTITETGRNWNTINARSNATCPNAGTVPYYQWSANGSAWVSGTQYQTVSYSGISWNQDITLTVTTSCTVSGVYSTYTGGSNSVSHTTLDSPSAWAANCAERTACWSGGCPAYTTSGSIHWWVNSAVQGAPWAAGDTGLGGTYTWAATGSTWGDGNVRSTTYCNGPWGTATAGGWGVFGSGCIPTIRSGWCNV